MASSFPHYLDLAVDIPRTHIYLYELLLDANAITPLPTPEKPMPAHRANIKQNKTNKLEVSWEKFLLETIICLIWINVPSVIPAFGLRLMMFTFFGLGCYGFGGEYETEAAEKAEMALMEEDEGEERGEDREAVEVETEARKADGEMEELLYDVRLEKELEKRRDFEIRLSEMEAGTKALSEKIEDMILEEEERRREWEEKMERPIAPFEGDGEVIKTQGDEEQRIASDEETEWEML